VKLSELEILQKLWSKWLSNSKFCSQIAGFSNKIKTTKRAQRKTEGQKLDVSLGKAQKNPTNSR
jgi:hypothetical protein